MTGCYKVKETRRLWGHIMVLCHVFTHRQEAMEAKAKCQKRGYYTRVQAVRHGGGTAYLLWRRK